jgi:hypothetical protein
MEAPVKKDYAATAKKPPPADAPQPNVAGTGLKNRRLPWEFPKVCICEAI